MKFRKIQLCFALLTVWMLPVFAGPPAGCCRPHCPPPPPPRHWHHHHHCGSSGVRLAADIVRLVGTSLNVLRSPVAVPAAVVPTAVVPAAVVPAPAVPVTGVPVAVQPVVHPYYYPPAVPDHRRYNNGFVPLPPICR